MQSGLTRVKAYKYALPNKSLSLPVPGESWRRSTATVGTTKPTDPAAPGPVHPGIGLVAIAASDSALLILARTFFFFAFVCTVRQCAVVISCAL
jgi:hypothetical protein